MSLRWLKMSLEVAQKDPVVIQRVIQRVIHLVKQEVRMGSK